MIQVYNVFTEMIVFLNGGSSVEIKNRDLVLGFYSPMAERICDPLKASFLRGDAIRYNGYVTPALTNFVGPVSDGNLAIYTGNSTG